MTFILGGHLRPTSYIVLCTCKSAWPNFSFFYSGICISKLTSECKWWIRDKQRAHYMQCDQYVVLVLHATSVHGLFLYPQKDTTAFYLYFHVVVVKKSKINYLFEIREVNFVWETIKSPETRDEFIIENASHMFYLCADVLKDNHVITLDKKGLFSTLQEL